MDKRVAWVAVAAVAVVLLGAPIGMGFAIQRIHARLIERADGSAPGLHVEGTFSRGLWRSQATTTIRLEGEGGPARIELGHEIVHGPIPIGELLRGRSPFLLAAAVVETRYAADPAAWPRIAAALGDRPLLRVIAWLSFDGSLRIEAAVPPIALAGGDVRFGGVRVAAHFEPDSGAVKGDVHVPPLAVQDGGVTLHAGDATASFDSGPRVAGAPVEARMDVDEVALGGPFGSARIASTRALLEGRWAGEGGLGSDAFELRFGEITLSGPDPSAGPPRRLVGLHLVESGRLDPHAALREFETEVAFERLETGDAVHGPGRAVLVVRRVDASAARDFRAAFEALDTAPTDDRAMGEAHRAFFAEWMPRLLASSPEAELQTLSLLTADGTIDGHGRIGVDGSDRETLADPDRWLGAVTAELALLVPESIVATSIGAWLTATAREEMPEADEAELEQAVDFLREATIEQLVAQGLLVRDQARYRVVLRFDGVETTVNGRPFHPGSLGAGTPAP